MDKGSINTGRDRESERFIRRAIPPRHECRGFPRNSMRRIIINNFLLLGAALGASLVTACSEPAFMRNIVDQGKESTDKTQTNISSQQVKVIDKNYNQPATKNTNNDAQKYDIKNTETSPDAIVYVKPSPRGSVTSEDMYSQPQLPMNAILNDVNKKADNKTNKINQKSQEAKKEATSEKQHFNWFNPDENKQ